MWKQRFEVLASTVAPTEAPIDLVEKYHDTPRLGRESRAFDADEQYWFISFDVVVAVLASCAALLIVYALYVSARKRCWRCQRSVEGSERRQCCYTGRDASRAQRIGLVAWVVMAVVVFAVLTILTQQRLDNTLHNLNDGFSDLGNAFDAIDAQTAALDDIGERTLAVSQQISCVDDAFEAVIEGAARAFADAAADAAAIAYAAAGDANKLGSRIRGKDKWLDGALLVLLTMMLLVLPCAAYGALAKSPKVLGGAAARCGCAVVACLSVLLAFEFGVLVKVSDFCVAPGASFTALVDERFTIPPSSRRSSTTT